MRDRKAQPGLWLLFRLHLLCFPPACRICGRLLSPFSASDMPFPYLCVPCYEQLPWKDARYSCLGCAEPTAEPHQPRCPSCNEDTHQLGRVWAIFAYKGSIRNWILRLKYQREEALAFMLGALLAAGAKPEGYDLLLPVPLHLKRLRQRGFNQAYLLAHAWRQQRAGAENPPPRLCSNLLRRHRHTRPQTELPSLVRKENVGDAFSLKESRNGATPLQEQRVLLVDDLMTTGATLNACAAILRQGGAKQVDALVLARA